MTTTFLPILVDLLPRTERIFLNLWAFHGMSQEEIADIYDCTETHVERVIERAIRHYEAHECLCKHRIS
ncbi:sigma factor-like helix-turn-helix DNA-binding protein [Tundrisphaera sp. TA3]|uniref:sigma factor-like helix-turn-helix DNA-binding protein n=1 Tax=Tundrisphaera sp. TA3 TaxID=3435775 RepID=UPI003EBA90C2